MAEVLVLGKNWRVAMVALGTFFLPLIQKVNLWLALVTLLVLYVMVVWARKRPELLAVIILCSLLQTQWAVAQFIAQGDINLSYLGETRLSSTASGVAKFGSEKIIRAYGPYSHANSMGGVVVMTLVMMVMLIRKEGKAKATALLFIIGQLGVMVSYSRAAIMSALILIVVVMGNKELRLKLKRAVGVVLLVGLVLVPFWVERAYDVNDKGLSERVSGYEWWYGLMMKHNLWLRPIVGSYKDELEVYLRERNLAYKPWQIDYVHSVPLLVVATVGIVPTMVLTVGLVGWLRKKEKIKLMLYMSILPLLLLDHYLVTRVAPLYYLLVLVSV